MGVLSRLSPKECLHSARALARSIKDHYSRVRQHAALTGINGSLAEINVESPACGARSKTTVVRKFHWGKLFFIVTYLG